jgi:hypothetical protein
LLPRLVSSSTSSPALAAPHHTIKPTTNMSSYQQQNPGYDQYGGNPYGGQGGYNQSGNPYGGVSNASSRILQRV